MLADALCQAQVAIDKHLIHQNISYKNLSTDCSIQAWINKELRISSKLDDEYVYQLSDNIVLKDKRELDKDNDSIISRKKGILSHGHFFKI